MAPIVKRRYFDMENSPGDQCLPHVLGRSQAGYPAVVSSADLLAEVSLVATE
jgi:hypothetical protein